jgi:hypothetical protein
LDNLVIDIEYNRNYADSKRVYEKCVSCKIASCFNNERNLHNITSLPDMIIHQRGLNEDNQVVIEYKKASNVSANERNVDKAKLIYFTCQQPYPDNEVKNYQFHIGFFIDLELHRYSVTTYQNASFDVPRYRQGGVWE